MADNDYGRMAEDFLSGTNDLAYPRYVGLPKPFHTSLLHHNDPTVIGPRQLPTVEPRLIAELSRFRLSVPPLRGVTGVADARLCLFEARQARTAMSASSTASKSFTVYGA
jgi:hypothetical protein